MKIGQLNMVLKRQRVLSFYNYNIRISKQLNNINHKSTKSKTDILTTSKSPCSRSAVRGLLTQKFETQLELVGTYSVIMTDEYFRVRRENVLVQVPASMKPVIVSVMPLLML